ncbi:HIT domain-containing protein [Agromyces sp. NPDC058110]|uniref:HIT domain-containing protein n=1 Tax=Agromyces sp. NPDC058110 TaxID=3346345 RepID=UPI0036D80EFC
MSDGIAMPEADRCAFCDYLSGARPYVFVDRNSVVAVAVTLEQRGRAHLLVLPVGHFATIMDIPDGVTGPLMRALRGAARAVACAEKPEGIAVWQNNGLAAAQRIPHLHFHVAGTLPGGGTDFGPVPEISLDQARDIAQRLAPFLDLTASEGTAQF